MKEKSAAVYKTLAYLLSIYQVWEDGWLSRLPSRLDIICCLTQPLYGHNQLQALRGATSNSHSSDQGPTDPPAEAKEGNPRTRQRQPVR